MSIWKTRNERYLTVKSAAARFLTHSTMPPEVTSGIAAEAWGVLPVCTCKGLMDGDDVQWKAAGYRGSADVSADVQQRSRRGDGSRDIFRSAARGVHAPLRKMPTSSSSTFS